MSKVDYLLVGHVTADLKGNKRLLGGTVSYSAPVARMFGRQVAIVTSCSACEPLIDALAFDIPIANHIARETTTFENVYEAGRRTQTLYNRANTLSYDQMPRGWAKAPAVHLAPVADELSKGILRGFEDATVMLTPQGLMRQWDSKGLVTFKYWCDPEILKKIDIVVFSKQDIQEMPQIEDDYAACVKHLIVTDGADGGIYYHQGIAKAYRAYPAEEIDPTGAGDVFATALLASLSRLNDDMHKAIDVAARLAALSVEQVGVGTFTPDQIELAIQSALEKVE